MSRTQIETRCYFVKTKPGKRRIGKKGYWYKCAHCGKWCGRPGHDNVVFPDDEKMEVDHIRPWYNGGSDAIWNLQPLCKTCNRNKSNRTTFKDNLKIIKNDIIYGDFVSSFFARKIRQSKVLKAVGLNKRK